MRFDVVLVPFPFDDLTTTKVRPALCLTNNIEPYQHVVVAFITSKVSSEPSDTDLVLDCREANFEKSGLKVTSTVRFHRLATVSQRLIRKRLGHISAEHELSVKQCLVNLFELKHS